MSVAALPTTQNLIADTCDEIKDLLLEKNRNYGDSALNPVRVFSRADSGEQIRVRLDDKLSRLAKGTITISEETIQDIIGYLVLLLIHERRHGSS